MHKYSKPKVERGIMKRAIVTGGTGVIGTAVIQELIINNIEVLVLCKKGSERNKNIPKNELVEIKYCDLEQLSDLKNESEKEYDIFYHFAWMGTVGEARNDLYLQNQNVRFALDAVNVAKRFGCKKFVGVGSQAEYGRVNGKLNGETPTFPETGYGIAKLCAGQMTRELAHQLKLEHVWVRILSVYGPNADEQSMVMSTIKKLQKSMVPEFTKGEQIWDFLYSSDAAEAFRLIGESGIDGKIYVLGSGDARPLKEYIEIIRDNINPHSELEFGKIPYSDKQVMLLCADVSEVEKDIGWKAKTTFADGIRKIAELNY